MSTDLAELSDAQVAIGQALRAHLERQGVTRQRLRRRLELYAARMAAANRAKAEGRPSPAEAGLGPLAYLRRYGTPAERRTRDSRMDLWRRSMGPSLLPVDGLAGLKRRAPGAPPLPIRLDRTPSTATPATPPSSAPTRRPSRSRARPHQPTA